jgi:hypothetical protein
LIHRIGLNVSSVDVLNKEQEYLLQEVWRTQLLENFENIEILHFCGFNNCYEFFIRCICWWIGWLNDQVSIPIRPSNKSVLLLCVAILFSSSRILTLLSEEPRGWTLELITFICLKLELFCFPPWRW